MNDLSAFALRPSWLMKPGTMLRLPDERTIVVHPLDLVAIDYHGEPLQRLDAAMKLLLDRTNARFERVARNLTTPTTENGDN
jgi:hypothetical protein